MEIKFKNHTITSEIIFNVLFAIMLIATASEIITSIFFENRFNTETILPLIFLTYMCYYFSNINKKK
ncbi:TPA: hypothetical protein LA742_002389 [Clostridium botulinum]|uniref:hypothetical protein n=1 Tax=Clostridium TaxID=1485 RepID=UPI0013D0DAE3|nr:MULTISPECIES: hypothetical protein [Clostridium]MDU7251983.1 hypothetical protein [Clostridium sp.]NFG03116.1 hypothetical protein [Clostridium sporogenes]HBJ2613912.1 hypothetical protein [Clostridium botulinum]